MLALVVHAAAADDIRFRRVDRAWGIDFRHHDGAAGDYHLVETDGSGVVVFDYDGDGDDDVLLVDGGPMPGYDGEPPRTRLFRNDGPGRFADVTARTGIDLGTDYGSGGAAGDVDSDGDLDLYVTAFGPDRLFLNDGDGTFSEHAAEAGLGDPGWNSSAAFADVDADGDLDLYVVRYVDATFENNVPCGDQRRRLRGYCGPDVYNPLPDLFYKNLGVQGGVPRFVEASASAGLAVAPGAGLGLSFADLDDDGHPDLYVANDVDPNFLFKNRGDGTFEDLTLLSGTALSHRGLAEAGMGVAIGDYDSSGTLDVLVTNYEGETHALYSNLGGFVFLDRRFVSGLAEPSLAMLTFGVVAADLDHDGDLDLVTANGHVRDNAELFNPRSRYRQPNQVFENLGDGRFVEVRGPGFNHVGSSRGLAAGDLDHDGDLDLVISNVADEAEVYENLGGAASGAWLEVDPRAVGARVTLTASGRRQVREVTAGSSYMSQHSLNVHFGLGAARRVERLEVRWPGGPRLVVTGLEVRRRILVRIR